MKQYLDLLRSVRDNGLKKEDRGNLTRAVYGEMFKHDMSEGFPLLTSKRIYHKGVRVELEGFLKGITDKNWYIERGCNIWNAWSNPTNDDHDDLGPFYGFQWRNFDASYTSPVLSELEEGIDQMKNIVDLLNSNPSSRE